MGSKNPFATTLELPVGAVQTVTEPALGTTGPRTVIQLPDGTQYEGEVRDGKPNGRGTLTDRNGTHQEGLWRNGNAYAVSGTLVFPDGTKETRTWYADGSVCGGTILWPDGRQYKGDWKVSENASELPHGPGEMTWPNGRKYVGMFNNGTMNGIGKMTYPSGLVENGPWKDGMFKGSSHP